MSRGTGSKAYLLPDRPDKSAVDLLMNDAVITFGEAKPLPITHASFTFNGTKVAVRKGTDPKPAWWAAVESGMADVNPKAVLDKMAKDREKAIEELERACDVVDEVERDVALRRLSEERQ